MAKGATVFRSCQLTILKTEQSSDLDAFFFWFSAARMTSVFVALECAQLYLYYLYYFFSFFIIQCFFSNTKRYAWFCKINTWNPTTSTAILRATIDKPQTLKAPVSCPFPWCWNRFSVGGYFSDKAQFSQLSTRGHMWHVFTEAACRLKYCWETPQHFGAPESHVIKI